MTSTDPQQDLAQRFKQGLKFHQEGNLNLAIAAYREVLSLAPHHPDALHLIGEAFYRLGQFDECAVSI